MKLGIVIKLFLVNKKPLYQWIFGSMSGSTLRLAPKIAFPF